MELTEIKIESLRYAKNFCFSDKYAVFCTGRKALIYDTNLSLLHQVDNLYYVYRALLSPDNRTVLLISNANLFYLLNLDNFSLEKYRIGGKYRDNLEGRGCWSFDGRSVYLLVRNNKTFCSAIRQYDLSRDMSFEDLFEDSFRLLSIKPVKQLKKYLLSGTDPTKMLLDQSDSKKMIWFDGKSLECYPICEIGTDVVRYTDYDSKSQTVLVYGFDTTLRYDIHGQFIEYVSLPKTEKILPPLSNKRKQTEVEKLICNIAKQLPKDLLIKGTPITDSINKISQSPDGNRLYIASNLGFFVVETSSNELIAHKKITYGVTDIEEIFPNIFFVSTWNGVKVFKLQ